MRVRGRLERRPDASRLALKLEEELPEVEALVVDDTGFPKKGTHSVGLARQYSGTLSRTEWWRNSSMVLNTALPTRYYDRMGVPRLAS